MAVFTYKAMDLDDQPISGSIIADTPRQARDQLRSKGLLVHQISDSPLRSSSPLWPQILGRRQPHQVTSFIRELSTLLGAGIPLLDAIDSIAEPHRGRFRNTLLTLRDRVAAGVSLAAAMSQQPGIFDELSVQVAEVGEQAGNLQGVLERLADFKERSSQFKSRLSTALLYPCLVLLMGMGVSVFLMTFVVPELLNALLTAGKPLPWSTRMVKAASDLLVQWGWLLLILAAVLVVLWQILIHTPRGRRGWHRLQLRLPLIGEMVRKQAVVRIAVVMATLLHSGVVFVRSLQIAQKSTRNVILRQALEQFEAAVAAGADLSVALGRTHAFPRVMVQILSVGQQSGRLEQMLERLAQDYDRQLATAAQRLTAVLEPLLIVILAVLVGFIAFATVLPILEAGNVM